MRRMGQIRPSIRPGHSPTDNSRVDGNDETQPTIQYQAQEQRLFHLPNSPTIIQTWTWHRTLGAKCTAPLAHTKNNIVLDRPEAPHSLFRLVPEAKSPSIPIVREKLRYGALINIT
jgi:hypothetical protein